MSYINVVNEVFVKQQRGNVVVLNSFIPYNSSTDARHFRPKQFFSNPEVSWITNRTQVIGTGGTPLPPPTQSSDAFIGQDTFPVGWPDFEPYFIQANPGFVSRWFTNFAYNPATDPARFKPQAKWFDEMMIPESFRFFVKPNNNYNQLLPISVPLVTVPNVIGQSQVNAAAIAALVGLGVLVIGSVYDSVNPVGTVSIQSPVSGQMAVIGTNISITLSLGPQPPPPYPGITLPQAIYIAINADLVVGEPIVWQYDPVVPYNYVISQTPPAGSVIPQQTVVYFVASLGPAPAAPGMILVPDFTGSMILDAQQNAINLGLSRSNSVLYAYSSVVPSGYVTAQSIVAGSSVASATPIQFTVSIGTPVTTLPGATVVTPTMH